MSENDKPSIIKQKHQQWVTLHPSHQDWTTVSGWKHVAGQSFDYVIIWLCIHLLGLWLKLSRIKSHKTKRLQQNRPARSSKGAKRGSTLVSIQAANKGRSALKLLRMAFGYLTVSNFKILYTVYIRPHLEHCIQAVLIPIWPYQTSRYCTLYTLDLILNIAFKQLVHIWSKTSRHFRGERRSWSMDYKWIQEPAW